ncbi:putative Receptor protein kinase, partial [Melia azedarach]
RRLPFMLTRRKKFWAFRRYILCQMSSSLRVSRSLQKQGKRECMLKNGKILLEKLIASCNGKHNPIQNFTAEELEAATNNYDPEKVITNDLLYKLYKGLLQDRQISVMKFEDNLEAGQYCFNCIEFASQMNHNNVLRFRGCCLESQIPILVFEFVSYGTLDNRIHGPRQSEYLTTGVCNEKSDVYSFGALLLELLTGKRIDHSSSFENGEKHFLQGLVKKHTENNTFLEIIDPVIVAEGLWPKKDQQLLIYTEIAFKCLSKWEEDRPTIVQVAKQLRQVYQSL